VPELTLSAHAIAGSRFINIYALIEYVSFISKHFICCCCCGCGSGGGTASSLGPSSLLLSISCMFGFKMKL